MSKMVLETNIATHFAVPGLAERDPNVSLGLHYPQRCGAPGLVRPASLGYLGILVSFLVLVLCPQYREGSPILDTQLESPFAKVFWSSYRPVVWSPIGVPTINTMIIL